jgi:hypothetical protein
MNNVETLQIWINHVFDHPVTDPPRWASDDAEEWPKAPFEHAGKLLSHFSDEQLDQCAQ